MSVQFGKCHLDGKPLDPKDLDEVRPVLAPYGPDGEGYICKDNFGIIYRAFHTTKESRKEKQPYISPWGLVLTWDGRLDNREELIGELHNDVFQQSTDLDIVAAAYQHWGTRAFAKLIGDWALSIWEAKHQTLILAKDFAGTRQLFYTVEEDQISWCTILEPLVLFAGHLFTVEEEYIAGWLSQFPATHLTPYVGIHSVPPSSFVRLMRGNQKVTTYWEFDPAKQLRYRTDAEYEEHFRSVFSQSVRRRLRSDTPVLAELSGGVDSTAIVCLADHLSAQSREQPITLETVSYYDDSEPNWNERPYFTIIENRRGRAGCHIELSSQDLFNVHVQTGENTLFSTPSACGFSKEMQGKFQACVASKRSRVLLSGIAGDEVLGGVPTPMPELQDLLARFQPRLLPRLKEWSLSKRKPWIHLLAEAASAFLPRNIIGIASYNRPAPWLRADFVNNYGAAFAGYESRLKLFGPLPSFQENLRALDTVRRQLSCHVITRNPLYERRYPYLDRNLLEFIFAVPRAQIVRPSQRRSLMRRALVSIVPNEILNRRRKAFVARSSMMAISREWDSLDKLFDRLLIGAFGFVDTGALHDALEQARTGHETPIVTIKRAVCTELWLRAAASFLILPECKPNAAGGLATASDSIVPDPASITRTLQVLLQASVTAERR